MWERRPLGTGGRFDTEPKWRDCTYFLLRRCQVMGSVVTLEQRPGHGSGTKGGPTSAPESSARGVSLHLPTISCLICRSSPFPLLPSLSQGPLSKAEASCRGPGYTHHTLWPCSGAHASFHLLLLSSPEQASTWPCTSLPPFMPCTGVVPTAGVRGRWENSRYGLRAVLGAE